MHKVDTSVTYSVESAKGRGSRKIENPEVEPVPEIDPPTREVREEPYLPDRRLEEVVNLAIAIGRPLLLQGDPGCGKTRLAYSVAYALGLPLEEAYIKSTSRAQDLIYVYDAVRRLYDAQLGKEGPRDQAGEPLARDVHNYIRLGPLGRAIARATYGRRSVLLIDEIDKADLDFPNDLLWELDRLEFRVPEAPDVHFAAREIRPIVIITHNEEKPLPTAFLRRCVFHYVEFPSERDVVERILRLHDIESRPLRDKAIDVIYKLRELDLAKKPGLSELIDWVGYQQAIGAPPADLEQVPHMQALLKQRSDQQRVQRELVKQ